MRHNHLKIIVSLFLTIIILTAFWQVQNHEFVDFDDPIYIIENRHVRSGLTIEGVIWAFTDIHTGNWHPLTWLSHMLDCELYGLNPKGHHFNNLLLHIANTLLLFLVLKRMTGALWRSSFVAALFALHPLHVESVAWVASRKDVLSTFFWILTMLAYVRYVGQPGLNSYLLVLISFALGLMAKPMLVTMPFVLLLLDYWPLGRFQFRQSNTDSDPKPQEALNLRYPRWIDLRLVWEKVPFFVFVAVSSIVAFYAQQNAGAMVSLDTIPLSTRIANSIVCYVTYMGKMIWPQNLAIIYPYPSTLPVWQTVGSALILVFLSCLFIKYIRLKSYLAVGWFWYLGTLVPVIGLVQLGMQSSADRYTYIPLIGLFIIISWGTYSFVKKWHHFGILLALLALTILMNLMVCTFLQVGHWRDSIRVFQHALDVTEDNYPAHKCIGRVLAGQGKLEEAISHFNEALKLKPYFAEAHNDLAIALAWQGNPKEAISHFFEALRIRPDYAKAHYNLAVTLAQQDRVAEAIKHYSEALRINPNDAMARHNLEVILYRIDEHKELSKPITIQ